MKNLKLLALILMLSSIVLCAMEKQPASHAQPPVTRDDASTLLGDISKSNKAIQMLEVSIAAVNQKQEQLQNKQAELKLTWQKFVVERWRRVAHKARAQEFKKQLEQRSKELEDAKERCELYARVVHKREREKRVLQKQLDEVVIREKEYAAKYNTVAQLAEQRAIELRDLTEKHKQLADYKKRRDDSFADLMLGLRDNQIRRISRARDEFNAAVAKDLAECRNGHTLPVYGAHAIKLKSVLDSCFTCRIPKRAQLLSEMA